MLCPGTHLFALLRLGGGALLLFAGSVEGSLHDGLCTTVQHDSPLGNQQIAQCRQAIGSFIARGCHAVECLVISPLE